MKTVLVVTSARLSRNTPCLKPFNLNKDQRQFLHFKYNHVILCGGYGTGKSILAQIKFKELINKAGVNDNVSLEKQMKHK